MTFSVWSRLGAGFKVLVMCLKGRFLRCLWHEGVYGDILKSVCRHLHGIAVRRVSKIGMGGIPGSTRGSGRKAGVSASVGLLLEEDWNFCFSGSTCGQKAGNSCLGGSASNVHSMGRIVTGGRSICSC